MRFEQALAAAWMARSFSSSGLRSLRSRALAPSDLALGGSSWTSTKRPSIPAATAARESKRNELRLAAADAVGRRGLLDGVGGVEDDGREPAHDGERAEIDDEVVVAEGGAALGEEDALVAGGANFLDAVAHVPGRDELAFLDVDGAAGFAGGDEQVGLTAEERGNLEDIDGFGGDFAVRRARGRQ